MCRVVFKVKLLIYFFGFQGRICRCNFECGELLDLEEKLSLFQKFHQLNYNGQTRFLASSCLKIGDIRRRRVEEDISRRTCSVEYFIPREDGNLRVCRKTLCNIYQITPRRLQILQDKIKFKKNLDDSRGLHDNRKNKIPDETKELVKNHISSFPTQENHYSRNESQKMCLNPDLNVKKMWELFCAQHPTSCTLSLYRDIFNSEFNLRFGIPRSDSCAKCDRLYVQICSTADENKLQALQTESKIHHMKADLAYKTLAGDTTVCKTNNSTIVLCIDLQQVLFCPKLSHNNVFYQRQLSCYNLAIHNQSNDKVAMCFWNETIAKRGSIEVTSCILRYVKIHFKPLHPGETRKLILWSDRCIGQNNNWKMVALMQHLIVQNYFSSVEQKFLTTGHSFLPCDRDFALIERQKKSATVYIPMDWVSVIANASSGRRFEVHCMNTEDFKNISVIETSLNKGSFKITENGWLQISQDDPTTLKGRRSHSVLQPWISHSLAKKERGRSGRNLPPVRVTSFPNAYHGPLAIKAAKKKDLQDMCRYIPLQYVDFYKNLRAEL